MAYCFIKEKCPNHRMHSVPTAHFFQKQLINIHEYSWVWATLFFVVLFKEENTISTHIGLWYHLTAKHH